jgi:hypothetical protein
MEARLRSNRDNTLPKTTEDLLQDMVALSLGPIRRILIRLSKGKEILGAHLFRVNGDNDLVFLMKGLHLNSNIGDRRQDKDSNTVKEGHLLGNKDSNTVKEGRLLGNKASNTAKEGHLQDSNMVREGLPHKHSKEEPHQERNNQMSTRPTILDGLVASKKIT